MRALVICVALLALAAPAAADTLPDSQTLRDRSDAAYGPAPAAYRQEIEFSGTAASGKRVIYRKGADRREIVDAGTIHTEFGTNKGDRWHLNANGHVVIDEPDPGLASRESFTTSVSRLSAPIDAYVISTINSKGSGTREFIDPKTWYVVRRETLSPNGKIVTMYDDFKTFGSRRLAGHWSVHDETTGSDTQYTTRDYVAGGVTDDDVAIPAMKRSLVEFPAGVDRVVLPAVFEPDGHIVVRLTIAGRGLDLLLDTGSSSITLDPGVASQLGLTVVAKMQSSGNAGRFATGAATVPRIQIGSLQMHDVMVSIVPVSVEAPGVRSVGLLGFDFLCESGITIDYEHQTVTVERYGSYAPPRGPRVITLVTRLGAQVPFATANINGAIAERVLIDTGAVGPFLIFDYFARRHPEALPHGAPSPIVFSGAGGRFETKSVTLDSFTLGNVAFKRFTGYVVTSQASFSGDEDGLIGPGFLRLFDLHLDYPNGTIYLVPNATGAKAMH